jgi:nucleoside-diphosphate-sugar epimerase
MVRVLVTGATGSLARALIPALEARGHTPFGLVRPPSPARVRDALSCPTRVACLDTGEGIHDAIQGMDAIVHCAGGGRSLSEADLHRNNTGTTRTLVEAIRADRKTVRRLVLTSSYAAMGSAGDGAEPDPSIPESPVSAYGRSKLEAERLILDPDNAFAALVIRPPAIHGPHDLRTLGLFKAAQRGWGPLPWCSRTTSWIHSDDVCSALVLALKNGAPTRGIYPIDDGAPRSTEEVLQALSGAVGRPVRRLPIPTSIGWPFAWVNEVIGGWTQTPRLFTRDKLRDLSVRHWAADTSAIRRDLGWTPAHDLNTGFKATADAFRVAGHL